MTEIASQRTPWVTEMPCSHAFGARTEQSWVVFPRHREPGSALTADPAPADAEFCGMVMRLRAFCDRCGEPLAFLGVPTGKPNTLIPVVGPDALELYLPLSTQDRIKVEPRSEDPAVVERQMHTMMSVMSPLAEVKMFRLERAELWVVPLDRFVKNGEPEIEDVRR